MTYTELYKDIIPEGTNTEEFTHIPEISSYNYNYYHYKGKLLLGISDDDCLTRWYISKYEQFCEIGYSYLENGELIRSIYT